MVTLRFNCDENQISVPGDDLPRGYGTYALARALNWVRDFNFIQPQLYRQSEQRGCSYELFLAYWILFNSRGMKTLSKRGGGSQVSKCCMRFVVALRICKSSMQATCSRVRIKNGPQLGENYLS